MDKEVKAPNPAVVEKAVAKEQAGDDLNQREVAALEAQMAIDADRGYRRIQWRPGIWMLQHIATQHTVPDTEAGETEMRRIHNDHLLSQVTR